MTASVQSHNVGSKPTKLSKKGTFRLVLAAGLVTAVLSLAVFSFRRNLLQKTDSISSLMKGALVSTNQDCLPMVEALQQREAEQNRTFTELLMQRERDLDNMTRILEGTSVEGLRWNTELREAELSRTLLEQAEGMRQREVELNQTVAVVIEGLRRDMELREAEMNRIILEKAEGMRQRELELNQTVAAVAERLRWDMERREAELNRTFLEKAERMRQREVELNQTAAVVIEGLRRDKELREAKLNRTSFERAEGMRQREVELNQSVAAAVERLREREMELNRASLTVEGDLEKQEAEVKGTVERTVERLKQREIELNKTVQLLRSRVQELEEGNAHARLKPRAGSSTPLADIAGRLQKLQIEPTDNETSCHAYGKESMHSVWFPWEVGLGYQKFDKEATLNCFRSLPNKHVLFLGDSIMRHMFVELMVKFGATTEEQATADEEEHRLNHYKTEDGVETQFVFMPDAKSLVGTLLRVPRGLEADVLFVGTGAWEIKLNLESNTLFMMSYIAGLSASIKYLQDNYKGRVIFLMTPPLAHQCVGFWSPNHLFQGARWNSKIQALNRFATKLVLGAGYEVLDIYDFLASGEGGFIQYRVMTRDCFHPVRDFDKLAIDIYTNEICPKMTFDYDTPGKIANLTRNFNGKTCKWPCR